MDKLSEQNRALIESVRSKGRACGFCECGDHGWVSLTRGYTTLFSPEDAPIALGRLWSANVEKIATGHHVRARAADRKSRPYLSKLILPIRGTVDHANQNSLDNRRPNLRPASQAQNIVNRKVRNSTGYRGICRDKKLWRAQISVGGKRHHCGFGKTQEEAARLYDRAAVLFYGEFAQLNFLDEAEGKIL